MGERKGRTNQYSNLEIYRPLMRKLLGDSLIFLKNFKISEENYEKRRNALRSYKWLEGKTFEGMMNPGENPFSFDNVVSFLYGENRVEELRNKSYKLLEDMGTLEYFTEEMLKNEID